jgi:hypothetical protein
MQTDMDTVQKETKVEKIELDTPEQRRKFVRSLIPMNDAQVEHLRKYKIPKIGHTDVATQTYPSDLLNYCHGRQYFYRWGGSCKRRFNSYRNERSYNLNNTKIKREI